MVPNEPSVQDCCGQSLALGFIPLRLIQARRSYRHYEVGQDAPPMGCGLKKDVSLHRTIGNRPVDISLGKTKQRMGAGMGQR